MREESLRATYINLFLLAAADGKIHPTEREYLRRFAKVSGISGDQERRWQREVESEQLGFQNIEDGRDAQEAVMLMARMVRVDDEFHPAEQEAYITMGKALGFTPDELGPMLREHWNKDPSVLTEKEAALAAPEATEPPAPPSPEKTAPASPPAETGVAVITDDIAERPEVERAARGVSLRFSTMSELPEVREAPDIVLFHAANDKEETRRRLETLTGRFPKAFVAFIARRDQAPQIGWVLGLGARRCFVEPLYPDEITRAVGEMK